MNKYSVLMLLPILFQINIYADAVVCPDLDMLIKNELQAAQIVMNKPIKLELQAVLDALILFAGKSKNNRTVGIESILLIQKSVNQCKSQQYTTWSSFTSLFGFHPELVTREIQPALKAIDSSLKSLNVSQSEISTASKVIGTVTVGLALTGVVIGGAVWWANQSRKSPLSSDSPDSESNNSDYEQDLDSAFVKNVFVVELADKIAQEALHGFNIQFSTTGYQDFYLVAKQAALKVLQKNINDRVDAALAADEAVRQKMRLPLGI